MIQDWQQLLFKHDHHSPIFVAIIIIPLALFASAKA